MRRVCCGNHWEWERTIRQSTNVSNRFDVRRGCRSRTPSLGLYATTHQLLANVSTRTRCVENQCEIDSNAWWMASRQSRRFENQLNIRIPSQRARPFYSESHETSIDFVSICGVIVHCCQLTCPNVKCKLTFRLSMAFFNIFTFMVELNSKFPFYYYYFFLIVNTNISFLDKSIACIGPAATESTRNNPSNVNW